MGELAGVTKIDKNIIGDGEVGPDNKAVKRTLRKADCNRRRASYGSKLIRKPGTKEICRGRYSAADAALHLSRHLAIVIAELCDENVVAHLL